MEYQFDIVHGGWREEYVNDPLNPRVAHGPFGSQLRRSGHRVRRARRGLSPTRRRGPGSMDSMSLRSKALRREQWIRLYLPARFREVVRYPLLIVHDGDDYLHYAAIKTVLDNLIHRGEVAPLVAAFVPPGDRLLEYANFAPHARFLARELTPYLAERLPLLDQPDGRALMGSSFGGVASLSTAVRYPRACSGRCCCSRGRSCSPTSARRTAAARRSTRLSGSSTGSGRGPGAVSRRIFQSCGIYEPLITPNRSMVSTFRDAGMEVRYLETRDGHNWENWRDQLRGALTWLFPGEQRFVYE